MIRKIITTMIFASFACSAFASSVNYIQVTNNYPKGTVRITYNEVTKEKSIPLTISAAPNQTVRTGVPPFGQEMPKYEITTITHDAPITICPILKFNTIYKVISITLNNSGCAAVTNIGQ